MQKSLLVFLLLTLSFKISAQANLLATQIGSSKVNWSGSTYLSYESNLYERSAAESASSTSAGLILNYHVKDAHLIRASISGLKELTQAEESKINDGYVSWVNNSFWYRGKVLTVGQQLRSIISASKESRVRDQKNLGVALIPSFVFNLTPVGLTGVTFIYQPSFVRNFHTYEQNLIYENNTEYGVSQTAILSWSLTDKLYLQPALVYGASWTYGGRRQDDKYSFSTEIGYSIQNSVTLALGMNNKGQVQDFQNGNNQNVQFYDKDTASVYSSLYYVF